MENEFDFTFEPIMFTLTDDDGKEIDCELLETFKNEATGKHYMLYTDNTLDEDGNTMVFASIYHPEEYATKLLPVETDEEWEVIEVVLKGLKARRRGILKKRRWKILKNRK